MAAQDPYASIKSKLFPTVLSAVIIIVWNDIREIKSDVKALMSQSAADKIRIDNLEREVFKATVSFHTPIPPDKDVVPPRNELVAILPDNKLTPKPL